MNQIIPVALIGLTLLITSCSKEKSDKTETTAESPITTFLLVRHAEKADDGTRNPPLTERGRARAELLAEMLGETAITAVYSTPFKRTVETVTPLANQLNLQVNTYDPANALHLFLEEVAQQNSGKKVLICGHSNTVPVMLNILEGGARYTQFADDAYDDLFLVSFSRMGKAEITPLKFKPVVN